MGLSSFPCAGDGLLPAVVLTTLFWVEMVKGIFRSLLQIEPISVGFEGGAGESQGSVPYTRLRPWRSAAGGVSGGGDSCAECSVCLCVFREEEELSELSCRHLFHRGCLEKWFGNKQRTCPLCRRFVV